MTDGLARTDVAGGGFTNRPFTRRDIERVTAQMSKGSGGALGIPMTGTGDHVEHICFDCGGGPATNTASGLIVVQTCGTCGGRGTLTNDEMDRRFPEG